MNTRTELRPREGAAYAFGGAVHGNNEAMDTLFKSPTATPYDVRFPNIEPGTLDQDEAYFLLEEQGETQKIRFHDYAEIYKRPGLYEHIFYTRLKCESPSILCNWLAECLEVEGDNIGELRVLDFGAGNGMVGSELFNHGVSRIVGVDILPEAAEATQRDRPGVYDQYLIADLADPDKQAYKTLSNWRFNCLVSVAALGFGDGPVPALSNALNLLEPGGWFCFNIKETFLSVVDTSGYNGFLQSLFLTDAFKIVRMQKHRHRNSIDGTPLYYHGVIGRCYRR